MIVDEQEVLEAYLRKEQTWKADRIEAFLREHSEEEYKEHLGHARAWFNGYNRGWREAQECLQKALTAPPQDVPTPKSSMNMEALSLE